MVLFGHTVLYRLVLGDEWEATIKFKVHGSGVDFLVTDLPFGSLARQTNTAQCSVQRLLDWSRGIFRHV